MPCTRSERLQQLKVTVEGCEELCQDGADESPAVAAVEAAVVCLVGLKQLLAGVVDALDATIANGQDMAEGSMQDRSMAVRQVEMMSVAEQTRVLAALLAPDAGWWHCAARLEEACREVVCLSSSLKAESWALPAAQQRRCKATLLSYAKSGDPMRGAGGAWIGQWAAIQDLRGEVFARLPQVLAAVGAGLVSDDDMIHAVTAMSAIEAQAADGAAAVEASVGRLDRAAEELLGLMPSATGMSCEAVSKLTPKSRGRFDEVLRDEWQRIMEEEIRGGSGVAGAASPTPQHSPLAAAGA